MLRVFFALQPTLAQSVVEGNVDYSI